MPLYEYQCPTCGHCCERLQRYDAPAPACPQCSANKDEPPPSMTRKISVSSFQLKGTGWAFDGYRSD